MKTIYIFKRQSRHHAAANRAFECGWEGGVDVIAAGQEAGGNTLGRANQAWSAGKRRLLFNDGLERSEGLAV